ncbi:hypothetical protein ACUIJ3_11215 [Enterobacter cloacae]|uniref:hypothetical protein n=1 Tax=Enterobacter cloacae TaxID=550 RepID=UPI004042DFEA
MYADIETGLHNKPLDPQVERFIVQDPFGVNTGCNLYQYALNPLGVVCSMENK